MADTVKLPGFGEVNKSYVIAGGGVLIVIIGVVYFRSKSSANAASAAAASTTATTDTTPIDEATGYPQGSAEDLAALAQQESLSGYGYSGDGTTNTGTTDTTTPTGYTSNAAWSQAAEQYIVDNTGGDPATVGNALGKYLTGGQLSSDMANIVDQAIAFDGQPPQAGVNGFPPSLNLVPITTSPPPPPPPTGTPPPPPPPTGTPSPVHDVTFHMFVPNSGSYDTLAKKYGVFGGSGQQLYQYQLTPNAQRSAAALAELKAKPYPYLSNGGTTAIPY